MRKLRSTTYFTRDPDHPNPLQATALRTVRFEEVDSLRIVWHGRYPSFFEDARTAFGEKYHLGYLDMYENGFLAPLIRLHMDYHGPLTYPETFRIIARAIWSEAARLNFEYEIRGPENRLVATGYSVQLFTDLNFQLQLIKPSFLEDFLGRWREGTLS